MVYGQLKLHHTTLAQPSGDVSPTHHGAAAALDFTIPLGFTVEDHTDDVSVSLCTPWRCMPSTCIDTPEPDTQTQQSHIIASALLEGVTVPAIRNADRRPQSISIESSTTAETGENRHSSVPSPVSSSPRQDLDWAPEQDEVMLPVQPSQGGVKESFLKELPRVRSRPKRSSKMASQGPPQSPGLPSAVWDREARSQGNRELFADSQVTVL
mmetsp:Transcript_47879/g.88073  ORF Transcript_47879/g.88073 Transcript_47879/m.88073 type:complete len:211 (+) Transcript_47879:43-675(+)